MVAIQPRGDGREENYKWVCRDCFREKYTSCKRCGTSMLKHRAFRNEKDNPFCIRCYLIPMGILNDYSFRPASFSFFTTNRDKKELLFFGIELEIEAKENVSGDEFITTINQMPHFTYPVHDGSIEYGFEVVGQPATYNWLLDNKTQWEDILSLRKKGWRSFETDTCGMHIHLSKNAFHNFHLYKFIKFFYSHPKFILQVSQRERKTLTRWASTQKGSDRKIVYKAKEKGGRNKYTAVNLQNRQTIEVRIFRGTLNPKSFWKNIEFTKAMFDFTNDTSAENLGISDFKKWILGHRKLFPNLFAFLTDRNFIALSGVEKE
jgi:hypothetical protein